jgi:hypothetical protein
MRTYEQDHVHDSASNASGAPLFQFLQQMSLVLLPARRLKHIKLRNTRERRRKYARMRVTTFEIRLRRERFYYFSFSRAYLSLSVVVLLL